jgi:DNA-binding NarL/FixJ family response regulator
MQEAGTRLAAIYAGAIGYVLKDMAEADVLVHNVMTLLLSQRPQAPWR